MLDVLPQTGLLHPDTTSPIMQSLLLAGLMATVLALAKWGGAALYALLSLSVFANIYWVYTADWSFVDGPPINPGVGGLAMPRDSLLATTLFSDTGIVGLSAMIVVVLVDARRLGGGRGLGPGRAARRRGKNWSSGYSVRSFSRGRGHGCHCVRRPVRRSPAPRTVRMAERQPPP